MGSLLRGFVMEAAAVLKARMTQMEKRRWMDRSVDLLEDRWSLFTKIRAA